ncbi:Methyltransferase-like protein isoform 2 [Schistosoma japonicum]|uniref:Methyltransferase-like protein isoform 2 n=1 Tax=Schistosoma japonicum TaxID=6182 RepID=A0A4Z2D174_SCHJA|nr:Methyltransferase-like protein isoform 2 [Schistosoma japonicum]
MCTLSRKKLHYYLENVKTFRNPKLEFEQYCTSAQVAADILFNVQMMDGALEGMSVADLGCGTGMLSIGAKLLGASCVLGFEIDEDAVTEFRSNLETYEMLNENINIALCDVHVLRTIHNTGAQAKVIAELRFDLPRSYKRHRYDTVDINVDFIHSWF